jgi:hypothetical protein
MNEPIACMLMVCISSCRKREENQIVRARKTSNVKAEPLAQG